MKKDINKQLELLISFLIKMRSQSYVCKAIKKGRSDFKQQWLTYVDVHVNADFEVKE